MNTLTKIKEPMAPFLDELRRDMEGFWDRPFLFRPLRPFRELTANASEWAPTMDVFDRNGMLVVKADLPGVKKSDVAVAIENGDLVVRGHRKEESEIKEADYYRAERSQGEFFRRVALAFDVDPKAIKATFTDGVLEVQVPYPLAKQPETKKIEIR